MLLLFVCVVSGVARTGIHSVSRTLRKTANVRTRNCNNLLPSRFDISADGDGTDRLDKGGGVPRMGEENSIVVLGVDVPCSVLSGNGALPQNR